MKHKSQVFDIFLTFQAMIRTQFQSPIRFVQTDWGGEYRRVSLLLQHLGIGHRLSCPYTQEQNGTVERRN